jgi:ferritin
VDLADVPGPKASFGTPLSIFQQALDHEKKVTELIHTLYELASTKKDYATQLELQWFIEEQVEEEDSVGAVVEQLDMVGDNRAALLMLDQQLGARSGEE